MNLIYDVESFRIPSNSDEWDTPWKLGFGSAVAYHTIMDIYYFFGTTDYEKCLEFVCSARNVIGFNNKRFDDKLINGVDGLPCNSVDLFEIMVRCKFAVESIEKAIKDYGSNKVFNGSLNLGSLAKGTFGRGKIESGSHAPKLIEQFRWAELFQYNLDDVRLTKNLYNHMMQGKDIVDKRGKVYDGERLKELLLGEMV